MEHLNSRPVSNNPVMFFPGNQHSFKKKSQITFIAENKSLTETKNRGSKNMI